MIKYYTSVTIIILLALAVFSILISENNRMPWTKKSVFLTTNLLIALAAVVEYAGVRISGNTSFSKDVLITVKAADYILTPMTGGALIFLMKNSPERDRIIEGLFIGNMLVQIASACFGWMVVVDDQNNYTHGPLYPLYMAFYLLILVILTVEMLSYGKNFKKRNRKSLYATMLMVCAGIAMQEILGRECRVAYMAAAFGVVFIYIHYSEFSQLRLDEKLTEQQVKLSNDPLTGVLSRFAYVEALGALTANCPNELAVFLIDVNGLKVVNDSLGHEAGDEMICGAAECIEETLGKRGQTFRIGGDEFVVLAPMSTEQVRVSLADLRCKTMVWSGKKADNLSLSVGYALAEEQTGCSAEELVKLADQRMYEQKKEYYRISGRDRRRE